MNALDYWRECVSQAAGDCGLTLTTEQLESIAYAVEGAHENYGMAFYSPPATDRISAIEEEYQARIDKLSREADKFREDAHAAVKRCLRLHREDRISIQPGGYIERY